MRICYVTLGFPPAVNLGGPILNAYHLARSLVQLGHRVTVCGGNLAGKNTKLFNGSRRVDYENIDVIYFNTHKLFPVGLHSFGVYVWPELFSFGRKELPGFDIVHLDGYRDFPTLVVSHFCRHYGIPYVIQARGTLRRAYTSLAAKGLYDVLLGRKILSNCALFIASSMTEREEYLQFLKGAKRVVTIPNGINLSEYAALPEPGGFRKRHGIRERILITYLGRLHPIKGIDVLVRAFRLIGPREEARLAIIGPDEDYKKDLAALARKEGIVESVSFFDALDGDEKLQAYVDSDVLVSAGASESFGMVAFEAIMCGVPVIASQGSGCGELLGRFGAGSLIPYGDVRRMAAAIEAVLADRETARMKVEETRERVRQTLAWSTIARQYEAAYQSVLS